MSIGLKSARRRHEAERILKRKERINGMYPSINFDRDAQRKMARHHLAMRKPCSCWMCGNQRKQYGPPAYELRERGRLEADMEAWEVASDDDAWWKPLYMRAEPGSAEA